MARAHFVKKARKAIPHAEIKKGESYWWWQFYKSGKRYSKTQPKASQLIGSAFLSQMQSFAEDLEELNGDMDANDIESERDRIADEVRSLGDECQEKLDNMPEGLQQGDTGQMLQERVDACEQFASDLESQDIPEKEEGQSDEEYREALQAAVEDLQSLSYEGP